MSATTSLADFRKEVETFFDRARFESLVGDGDSIPVLGGPENDEERVKEVAQKWRAALYDAGLGWITGPREYGGRELTSAHESMFHEVEAGRASPDQGVFQVSRGMVSPAVLSHGHDELKHEYLPAIHRGEVVCCQLLSESEAGSDLGALRTTAVRDGDDWIVNGQKVWSSFAHVATTGQLVARTDPDAPKRRGLTMFLLPMNTPGVTVRPLRQMNGGAHFNEVFLDDVRVPDRLRVGAPGEGWAAILTTLMNERHTVAARGESPDVLATRRVFRMASDGGFAADPVVRQELAEVHIHHELLRFIGLRQQEEITAGREPGAEGSVGKLLYSAQLRRIGELAVRLAPGDPMWEDFLCSAPGLRIAGGTDEIQRNTLGERVLGLPREPR